ALNHSLFSCSSVNGNGSFESTHKTPTTRFGDDCRQCIRVGGTDKAFGIHHATSAPRYRRLGLLLVRHRARETRARHDGQWRTDLRGALDSPDRAASLSDRAREWRARAGPRLALDTRRAAGLGFDAGGGGVQGVLAGQAGAGAQSVASAAAWAG